MACLLLSGCEMIDYHPYDVRIDGETNINAHHIPDFIIASPKS